VSEISDGASDDVSAGWARGCTEQFASVTEKKNKNKNKKPKKDWQLF
jgi:hypothetical protein